MKYDVAIIGAGVTGSAIARELSRYNANVCVIEREEDVCSGTSKANSAIVHAGFDAVPGTVKALMNVQGNEMMDKLCEDLDVPFNRNGAFVVCTKNQDRSALDTLYKRGIENGVKDLKILERDELIKMEPNLADDVTCALYAPTSGIICPFNLTIALAENANENGVDFFLNTEVKDIKKENDSFIIKTNADDIEAKAVVNAAGVYADAISHMVSSTKMEIIARRGQYMLLDKTAGTHVSHTIFQLPSEMGKGVLVSPTIHGNLLVGPTAEDVPNKEGLNTTGDGLGSLAPLSALSVKDVPYRQVITSFAGLRAHEVNDDFIIGEDEDTKGFYQAAGIESPGLSSAPAIGVALAGEIARKEGFAKKDNFKETRKGILNPATLSLEERNELIKKNPAYGTIICRCEMITEGEIIDAIKRPLGARSLDAVKRRTRAGMGRCQSGFCSPRTMEIISRECNIPMEEISKHGKGSEFIVGINKEV
ncbi:MAG: NAD(P)/FAD-dependent oxidoreductase [Lachnospiraceae bacterium]|nr:NAD(P)/FAD-dependent oxidoreductase [Lachnospiraceae bacterium]